MDKEGIEEPERDPLGEALVVVLALRLGEWEGVGVARRVVGAPLSESVREGVTLPVPCLEVAMGEEDTDGQAD